jgi:sulfur transfer complex TusBCD TusB component (DsrH family)
MIEHDACMMEQQPIHACLEAIPQTITCADEDLSARELEGQEPGMNV